MRFALSLVFVSLAVSSCTSTRPEQPSSAPFVAALGTAQDGGLPQMACRAELCRAARSNPARRRLVASLLIADPASGERWLIDATPDIALQVERSERLLPRAAATGRPPLFDGVFLTHAHMGHYLGLAHFGKEAYGSQTMRVYGSQRMKSYLRENGPWDLLVKERRIAPIALEPDVPLVLNERLSVTPFLVPHRDEYTDTFGYVIRGPERSLVYIPDIDKWSEFTTPIESLVARHDIALLDGSFYADGEVPGRSMAEIRHPFIVETLDRFEQAAAAERSKVHFIHLNHTNPATDPNGSAAQAVRAAGMAVAYENQRFAL